MFYFSNKPTSSQKTAGFTLIELMVSLGLFTVVTLAAVSSLYTVNSAAKKVEGMRSVLDNLNFAVDSMSRTLRTGTYITPCLGGTPIAGAPSHPFAGQNPCDRISVRGTLGKQADVEYMLADVGGDNCITHCEIRRRYNGGSWVSLTAPEINVSKLDFYVDGTDNNKQPGVLILIQGVAKSASEIAPFSIQTYVSQRSTEQ